MMKLSKEMNQKSISFDLALEELARLIHKISIHQIIPESLSESSLKWRDKKIINFIYCRKPSTNHIK